MGQRAPLQTLLKGERQPEGNNDDKRYHPHGKGNSRRDLQGVAEQFRQNQDGGDLHASSDTRNLNNGSQRNEPEEDHGLRGAEAGGGREGFEKADKTEDQQSPLDP